MPHPAAGRCVASTARNCHHWDQPERDRKNPGFKDAALDQEIPCKLVHGTSNTHTRPPCITETCLQWMPYIMLPTARGGGSRGLTFEELLAGRVECRLRSWPEACASHARVCGSMGASAARGISGRTSCFSANFCLA